MNITRNIINQPYAATKVGFKGEREKKFLLNAIKHHPEDVIIRSANQGVFKGITHEELNSFEIKEAIKKRKAKRILNWKTDPIDLAIEIIKESFAK